MALGLLVTGCARYEYAVVQPPELATHVDRDGAVIDQPPLVYHLVSYDNRLVIRIENPGDQPVQLVGERSWIVSPDGESRPLPTQAIAPQSHLKLILPPMQPTATRVGPSIGFGIGASSGGRVGTGVGVGMPLRSGHYTHDDHAYWDWRGQTEVRMHLSYERDGERWEHDFTFLRQKM